MIEPPQKKYKRNDNRFIDDLNQLYKEQNFRKPYKHLIERNREKRVDYILKYIAASVIDRNEFEKNDNSCDYLMKNQKTAEEMMNIVMALKGRIENRFNVDLANEIEACDEVIEEDIETQQQMKDRCCVKTAVSILLETSDRGFKRITNDLKVNLNKFYKAFKMPTFEIPSIHNVRKLLPIKIQCINTEIVVDACKQTKVQEIIRGTSTVPVKEEEEILQLFSRPSNFTNSIDETNKGQQGKQTNTMTVKLSGAKLDGSFDDYLVLMGKKIKSSHPSYTFSPSQHLICTTSFDGAEAFRSKKNLTSVLTMSSFMFSKELLEQGMITPGSSLDILTWLQLMAKEEIGVLDEVTKDYYNVRTRFNNKSLKLEVEEPGTGIEVFCYDTHDGKMIYELTQHSSWSRKHHPYVLCKCNRGASTMTTNHICEMMSDQEYERLWKNSKERYDNEIRLNKCYTKETHRKWCDKDNFGVTHFGIDPKTFPLSTIRFDVFHMFMAITRKVMSCVREYTSRRPRSFRDRFTREVLSNIWGNFHTSVWNNGLAFGCFQGNELFEFIYKSEVVTEFLRKNLHQTPKVAAVIRLVELLQPMKSFCNITTIVGNENIDAYPSKIESFEKNVKEFHKNSVTCGVLDDDTESFYYHALVYYLPHHARETWRLHKLGLGIFNMQGFERRNKESKDTLKRFSTMNRKCAAFLVNNIRRLLTVFWFQTKKNETDIT